MTLISAAQLVAKVRWRFDLERQTTRHSSADIVDVLNDVARLIRRELFDRGSRRGIVTTVIRSADGDDTIDQYPGQRIDSFGLTGEPLAERIHCVEFLGPSGAVRLPEIDIGQAQDIYGSSSNTGYPEAWFPVGPVECSDGVTVGVCVTPRQSCDHRFRVSYLPEMEPITLSSAGPPVVADHGINDMLIPLEWLLAEMGTRVGIRDDDAQLINLREAARVAARDAALGSLSLTSTSEMERGRASDPRMIGRFLRSL